MKQRRVQKQKSQSVPIFLLLLMLPVAFWLGRETVETPAVEPVAGTPAPALSPCVKTSTAGLCPCPAPRKARPKKITVLPIDKKQTPPKDTALFDRDPTEPTARYLREHAADLVGCAPKTGARIRVHLEVQVAPAGAVEKVRITNLEPLPSDIATCVDRALRALKPPGFDGTSPEIFALTVVL